MNTTTKTLTVATLGVGLVLGPALVNAFGERSLLRGVGNGDPGLVSEATVAQLGLSPFQQAHWDALAADRAEDQRLAGQTLESVRGFLEGELAQPEPDLAAVSAEMERTVDELLTAARENRDEALALYAGFTPEQKQVVAAEMAERLERLDRVRRWLSRVSGTRED